MSDHRLETRRRREARTDAVIELPYNEPTEVECPACGTSFEVTIATAAPSEFSPTFGACSAAECDAFLKYRHEAAEPADTDHGEGPNARLDAFASGQGCRTDAG